MSKYYRVHTDDIAWITQQPRGIFTAVGKLVDAKILTEDGKKENMFSNKENHRGYNHGKYTARI